MTKKFFSILIRDIFIFSFVSYVILFIFEWYKTGIVTNYFNINLVLLICLVSGIITALVYKQEEKKNIIKTITYFSFYFVLSILFGILIYNSFEYSGGRKIVIAVIAGLVLNLSLLLIYNND